MARPTASFCRVYMSAVGIIIAYSDEVNAGVIKSSNGRFVFVREDWIGEGEPRIDLPVRFESDGNLAYDIIDAPLERMSR